MTGSRGGSARGGDARGGNTRGGSARGGNTRGGIDNGGNGAIVLSLGSNLGDRLANLQLGVDVLAGGGLDLQAVSSVYETDPVGGVDQADYLNAVLLAGSSLRPRDILARCATAETAAGRVRTQRWGPRTLDVDIIICGAVVSSDPALTLPHPRAHERAFVLVPWLELDAHAVLPGWGPVASLLRALPATPHPTGPHSAGPDSAGPDSEGSHSTGPNSSGTVRRRPELRLMLPVPEADAPCS